MAQQIILSVTATDRPGLVEAVARIIAEHEGNWLASSLARLAGRFAGIVQADIPAGRREEFNAAIAALSAEGIDVTLEDDTSIGTAAVSGSQARIELTGSDQPGIVREISAALAKHEISIEQFHTQIFKGSMAGEALFSAEIDIVMPDDLNTTAVRDTLEDIAADIQVEIDFKLD